MARLETVCQEKLLAREPAPAEIRINVCPREADEITELVHGLSLAPPYSSKQLREIRRRFKKSQLRISRHVNLIVEAKVP